MIAFVVSLLVGALGIHVGARVLTPTDDYTYAIVTALIGSVVGAVVAFLVGWIPYLGPLLVLLGYLAVINWRYPGDWGRAVGIALVAWVSVVAVLSVLAVLGVATLGTAGVPGA